MLLLKLFFSGIDDFINHVFQEANQATDLLAKFGAASSHQFRGLTLGVTRDFTSRSS